MCRLLALAGRSVDANMLRSIIYAFVESSRHDPYLARIIEGRAPSSHDDGWGLVAVGIIDGEPTIAHYKTVEPIFSGHSREVLDLYLKKISGYEELYVVIHARKASRREPYGVEYAHPYMMLSERAAAWFAHNGGANKKQLAEKLGVNPWLRVDSELLGFYVMDTAISCIEGGGRIDSCVVEAYQIAKHYVVDGSALNTVLLILHCTEPHLYVTQWIKQPKSQLHKEYFDYVSYVNSTLAFAGSISIRDYLPRNLSTQVVEPGIYKLKPGILEKISEL